MKYGNLTLGQIEAFMNKIGGEEGLQRFLAGHCEVMAKDHVINCDTDPFVPEGWRVEDHEKGGLFKWDPKQVRFYLSDLQKNGKTIQGNELRKKLAGKPVLNANVLDYLLAHPHLIPEEWKKDSEGRTRYIFFWGTIYRDPGGHLVVRCLGWRDGKWHWHSCWLDYDWRGVIPAALRAS